MTLIICVKYYAIPKANDDITSMNNIYVPCTYIKTTISTHKHTCAHSCIFTYNMLLHVKMSFIAFTSISKTFLTLSSFIFTKYYMYTLNMIYYLYTCSEILLIETHE